MGHLRQARSTFTRTQIRFCKHSSKCGWKEIRHNFFTASESQQFDFWKPSLFNGLFDVGWWATIRAPSQPAKAPLIRIVGAAADVVSIPGIRWVQVPRVVDVGILGSTSKRWMVQRQKRWEDFLYQAFSANQLSGMRFIGVVPKLENSTGSAASVDKVIVYSEVRITHFHLSSWRNWCQPLLVGSKSSTTNLQELIVHFVREYASSLCQCSIFVAERTQASCLDDYYAPLNPESQACQYCAGVNQRRVPHSQMAQASTNSNFSGKAKSIQNKRLKRLDSSDSSDPTSNDPTSIQNQLGFSQKTSIQEALVTFCPSVENRLVPARIELKA